MMDLVLAIFEEGRPDSCRVRYVDTRVAADVAYAPPVLNRIRIQQGDLVVVDQAAEPPAVVWRWWHGTAEGLHDGRTTVSRRRGDAEHRTDDVDVPHELQAGLQPGDTVFFSHGPGAAVVVDVALDGMPVNPERIRTHYYPEIEAFCRRPPDA